MGKLTSTYIFESHAVLVVLAIHTESASGQETYG